MERVTGIGGIFFRSDNPAGLAAWYREHLGVPVPEEESYGSSALFEGTATDAGGRPAQTVWSPFPRDTQYFGPSGREWMINYRVSDLDAMLAQLRAAGVRLDDKIEDAGYGRFAWGYDPEGNKFELWEPTVDA